MPPCFGFWPGSGGTWSEIDALVAAGSLSRFAEQSLDKSLATLLDMQGGCERIQKTPLPGASGRVLEDPFTMLYNGLPLHALSATIERNLRECLGESGDALPEIPQPVDGILM